MGNKNEKKPITSIQNNGNPAKSTVLVKKYTNETQTENSQIEQ